VFDYATHEQLYKDLRAMFDPAGHAAANPHLYTREQFVNAMRGTPWGVAQGLLSEMKPPAMLEQAQALAIRNAELRA
jgi:hypothetical protein